MAFSDAEIFADIAEQTGRLDTRREYLSHDGYLFRHVAEHKRFNFTPAAPYERRRAALERKRQSDRVAWFNRVFGGTK